MTDDTQHMIDVLDRRVERRNDRRAFFKQALGVAAVAGAGAFVSNRAIAQAAPTEVDVLNFALNLEYLEANFYSYAVFGTPITDVTGTGTQGLATGGRKVTFTDPVVAAYAKEIAQDEIAHVRFLRDQLKTSAVAQPTIDVGITPTGAFSSAARAAGIITDAGKDAAGNPLPQTTFFDPYADDNSFLLGAFIFEDVGVTAYKGGSPLLNTKAYIDAAAGILAAEAYHASIIRTVLYTKGIATPALITNTTKISDARDSLDGTTDLDQGVAPTTTGVGLTSNIAPTDSDGIAFSRTTGQVLNIVYLKPPATGTTTTPAVAATSGGFFPNGVNGTIKAGTTA